MTRAYRYALRPTKRQERILLSWLEICRELYNAALQHRRDAWKSRRIRVTEFDQVNEIPAIRDVRPEVNAVPAWILRGALTQVERSFLGFFRRCESGKTPGYPRFRSASAYSTLHLEYLRDKNPIVAGGKRIVIPRLGKVKLHMHRAIEGVPKTLRITHKLGKWYVSLTCVNVPARPLPPTGREVGVDLGLIHFAATSDSEIFKNLRPLEEAEIKLARADRRVARKKKRSRRQSKAQLVLSKHHARVRQKRRENHIAVAHALIVKYDRVFVEELRIANLRRGRLSKQITDAAWGDFLKWLHIKAESAGREVIEIDPRGTSQICSGCDNEVRKTLADRIHDCPHCGLRLDRDVNAARNILKLGRSLRRDAALVKARRRPAEIESSRRPEHTDVE